MNLKKTIIILTIALSISMIASCGVYVKKLSKEKVFISMDHVVKTNYTLNEPITVFTGERMIQVKDYFVEKYQVPIMAVDTDYTINEVSGKKGDRFNIIGTTKKGKQSFYVVKVPAKDIFSDYWHVLVSEEGRLYHKYYDDDNHKMLGEIEYMPSNLRFMEVYNEEIKSSSGYINYEIIYSGTDGNAIKMLFREYTADDLIRPAFHQELIYSASSNTIRFKNLRISIDDVNSESISFKVIEDGY